ncbi:MAG TPA: 2-oxoglutarate dehydrogenase E1 component, partial [Ginsengibacter sp.]|nr:2-oxoglutarate dehydrogenase E1 component [Ginsengibacter sp.]
MKDFSFITASHPSYIENLYFDFKKDPESIDGELRKFFEGYDFAVSKNGTGDVGTASVSAESLTKEFGVYQLIQAYRKKGHLIAKTNPIRERKDRRANLSLDNFGLSENDLDSNFEIARIAGMPDTQLRKILEHLKKCYASSVGIEFDSVNDPKKIQWIINAAENLMLRPVAMDQKKRILEKLNQGVMFEEFLQKKYIGQKRFS